MQSKKVRIIEAIFFILIVVFSLKVGLEEGMAGWTAQTNSGPQHWTGVAYSAAGDYLYAVSGSSSGQIYKSSDNGVSWEALSGAGIAPWTSVATNSSGSIVVASTETGLSPGRVYVSLDGGENWSTFNPSSTESSYRDVGIAADGSEISAVSGNYIYISYNHGVNWTEFLTQGESDGWRSMILPNNGSYIYAAANSNDYIIRSDDGGSSWIVLDNAGQRNWYDITSSSDGTKLAAVVNEGYIYTSINAGSTWTARTSAGQRNWTSIASSADGTKLAAATQGGYIYTSSDSGVTWTEQTSAGSRGWVSITSTSDGARLAAAAPFVNLYTFEPDTTAPTITSISSDKANGTYGIGEVIDIDVTFSEAVTSTEGNVTVTLETGTTDRTCTFTVSNSTTGTCNYTVQAGDTSADLTVSSFEGTIEDQSENEMTSYTIGTNLAANKALVIETTPPSISSLLPSGEQASGTTSVTLEVTTDTNATCKYGTTADTAYASISNTFDTTGTTTHTQEITGLTGGTSYTYYVRCIDAYGNANTSDETISFSIAATVSSDESEDTPVNRTPSSKINSGGSSLEKTSTSNTSNSIEKLYISLKDLISSNPDEEQIKDLIQRLKEQFEELFKQIEEGAKNMTPFNQSPKPILFTKDLELSSNDSEVKLLQQFLNNNGYIIAPSGPGSIGNETTIFGYATRAALIRFQTDNSILPAEGYFGEVTRGIVNGMLN